MSSVRVVIDEVTREATEYTGPTEIDQGQHDAVATMPRIRLAESHRFTERTGEVETSGDTVKNETPWGKPGVLSIGGMEVDEASAIAAGLAVRNRDGSVTVLGEDAAVPSEVNPNTPQGDSEATEVDAEDAFITEKGNDEFAEAASQYGITEGAFAGATAAAIGAIINGNGDPLTAAARAVTLSTGVDPEQAQEAVAALGERLQNVFDKHAGDGDPEMASEFYQWARDTNAAKFSAALNEALQGNSTRTLKSLVQDYQRASRISEGEARAMGIHTFQHPKTGETLAVLDAGTENEQVVRLDQIQRRYTRR